MVEGKSIHLMNSISEIKLIYLLVKKKRISYSELCCRSTLSLWVVQTGEYNWKYVQYIFMLYRHRVMGLTRSQPLVELKPQSFFFLRSTIYHQYFFPIFFVGWAAEKPYIRIFTPATTRKRKERVRFLLNQSYSQGYLLNLSLTNIARTMSSFFKWL